MRYVLTCLIFFLGCLPMRSQQIIYVIPNAAGTVPGEVCFVDTNNYPGSLDTVCLKAPADVTTPFDITLPAAPPTTTTRCLEMTTGGVLQYAAGACGVAGAALPVPDTTSIVEGSGDDTKELRFEVDGFTTGTVRTLTPQNASYTIAGTNVAQTFSANQTFAANILMGADNTYTVGSSGAWPLTTYGNEILTEDLRIANAARTASHDLTTTASGLQMDNTSGGPMVLWVAAGNSIFHDAMNLLPETANTGRVGSLSVPWAGMHSREFIVSDNTGAIQLVRWLNASSDGYGDVRADDDDITLAFWGTNSTGQDDSGLIQIYDSSERAKQWFGIDSGGEPFIQLVEPGAGTAVEIELHARAGDSDANSFLINNSAGSERIKIGIIDTEGGSSVFAGTSDANENIFLFGTTTDANRGVWIDGDKIIGAQGAAVADASGGVVIDAEARAALNALLARLRTHGLISP